MELIMENWRGFLAESKLRVFDFDDTIAKSDSNIHVITDTGERITMTPAEYATHEINPNYEYDYSEFSDVINPREVKQITRIIRNALGAGGDREIAILTARSPAAEEAIKDYLEQIGMNTSRITFKLLGDSDPQAKADWIRGRIEDGATDVLFFDDSGKNVDAVQNLAGEYPDVRVKARHVKYAEDLNEEILTEKCWPGYEKKGMKKMFGKMYPNCVKKKRSKKKNEAKDPAKGTGKKPKGSGRRLYTDEDPSDTVSVKFSTVQDIKDTLSKASFKSKSHKRQSQIINLIHQRARAAYQNAKDPKVKARLKKSYEYAKKRKEASKRKTQRMNKDK